MWLQIILGIVATGTRRSFKFDKLFVYRISCGPHLVLPERHVEEGDPRGGVLAVQLRPLRVQALHDEVEGLQNGQDEHYFLRCVL